MSQDPKEPPPPNFVSRFKAELALNPTWTQNGVAERAGIVPQTLSKWMKGPSEPRASDLLALVKVFGCTVDYLIGRSPHRTPLPASHYVLNLDHEDRIRNGGTTPDGRIGWPIPDHHEIVTAEQMEERLRRALGKKPRSASKEGEHDRQG